MRLLLCDDTGEFNLTKDWVGVRIDCCSPCHADRKKFPRCTKLSLCCVQNNYLNVKTKQVDFYYFFYYFYLASISQVPREECSYSVRIFHICREKAPLLCFWNINSFYNLVGRRKWKKSERVLWLTRFCMRSRVSIVEAAQRKPIYGFRLNAILLHTYTTLS